MSRVGEWKHGSYVAQGGGLFEYCDLEASPFWLRVTERTEWKDGEHWRWFVGSEDSAWAQAEGFAATFPEAKAAAVRYLREWCEGVVAELKERAP